MIFCLVFACSDSIIISKNIIVTIPSVQVNKIQTKNILKVLNYRLKHFRSINGHFWVVVCLQIHFWMWRKWTKSWIFVWWEDLQLRVLRDFFLFKGFSANWANELRDPCTSLLSRILQVFPGLWLLLSFTQWDYAGLWWGGGEDFQLITLEMALCGFYTDSALSAPLRPNPDSGRFWTREVDWSCHILVPVFIFIFILQRFLLTCSVDVLQPDVLKHSSLVW